MSFLQINCQHQLNKAHSKEQPKNRQEYT